jgi:hypothetical protein
LLAGRLVLRPGQPLEPPVVGGAAGRLNAVNVPLRSSCGAVMYAMMEAEITGLAGPKGRHNRTGPRSGTAHHRRKCPGYADQVSSRGRATRCRG